MNNCVTPKEAAELLSCSRVMIYTLIKAKRIRYVKSLNKRISIDIGSLDEYLSNRWDRRKSAKLDNGEFVFQGDQITILEAAKILGLSKDKIYYMSYRNYISTSVINGHRVFYKSNIEAYKQKMETKEIPAKVAI